MVMKACPAGVDRMVPVFNLRSCKFSLDKDKENTARIVIYKEIGILASYTLESTFYGSEFLKRLKPGVSSTQERETVEKMTQRYDISFKRKDISLLESTCVLMGEDFIKGINYASKKKPLVNYWFRNPPPVKVEIANPIALARENDPDVDPVLLELEKAWRPIGAVQQDRYLGVGDRYTGPNPKDRDIVKTPPIEPTQKKEKDEIGVDAKDMAVIDKERKKKDEIKKYIK